MPNLAQLIPYACKRRLSVKRHNSFRLVVTSGLSGLVCCGHFQPVWSGLCRHRHSAQQIGQRDAPPVGGFEVLVFIRVRRLRLAFVGGAPLTVTLGNHGEKPSTEQMRSGVVMEGLVRVFCQCGDDRCFLEADAAWLARSGALASGSAPNDPARERALFLQLDTLRLQEKGAWLENLKVLGTFQVRCRHLTEEV